MSQDYKPALVGANGQPLSESMKEQEKVPGFKDMTEKLGKEIESIKDKEAVDKLNEAASMMKEVKDAKQKYVDEHRTEINDEDITLFPKPYKSCDHCYGRGVESWDHITKDPNLCRCILNRMGRKDIPLLNVGELRSILNYTKRLFNIKEPDDETSTENIQGTDKENSDTRAEEQSGLPDDSSK